MNTKHFGNIGLGAAINYFLSKGIIISLPINDSQSYDLVAHLENGLQRIEVKTSNQLMPSKNYLIDLRTTGGNSSRNTIKNFDKTSCDYVFAHTSGGDSYLIPSTNINNVTAITLYSKYEKYKIECGPCGGTQTSNPSLIGRMLYR